MKGLFETKVIGKGEKLVGITLCIHGDEIVGKYVHDWFLKNEEMLKCRVKLIFGNKKAYLAGKRFIVKNLNRVFPGKKRGCYEERQAYRIVKELRDCDIHIDMHSTTENLRPFVVAFMGSDVFRLLDSANVKNVIILPREGGYKGKTLEQVIKIPSICIECGQHKSKKTFQNAKEILTNIFSNLGFIDGKVKTIKHNYFIVEGRIRQTEGDMAIEKRIDDFKKIRKGQKIAVGKSSSIVAGKDFYPIFVEKKFDRRENGTIMLVARKVSKKELIGIYLKGGVSGLI